MREAPDSLRAALSHAAHGWPVLPLEPGGKRPIGTLVRHDVKDATTDESTIRRWWEAHPTHQPLHSAAAAHVGLWITCRADCPPPAQA